MAIGQKLQRLRKMHRFTQEQVSKKIHVSRTCYANYEGGTRKPSYEAIVLLADVYQVSIDYLLRDECE